MTPFDALIGHAVTAGRASWPGIAHAETAFAAWARAGGVGESELRERGAELYLASACAAQDPVALEAFVRGYILGVPLGLASGGQPSDLAEDVRQQLQLTLLVGPSPYIASYRGQGPLGAWVRVCAARLAIRLQSKQIPAARARSGDDASMLDALVAREGGPELDAAKAQHRDLLQQTLTECFQRLPARSKTLLRMSFLDGMSIDEIGVLYRVHRATVARWLVAVRREVMAELRERLRLQLGTRSSELSSLVRLVYPDVQLSLRRLLADDASPPGRERT